MKAIIQRVLSASVTVDSKVVSKIGKGLLVLAAVAPDDTLQDVEAMANKLLKLKVWDAEDGGKWKKSVVDFDFQILLVSQFTLLATTKKGNKPDFHGACPPNLAKDLYQALVQKTRTLYMEQKRLMADAASERVQDGVFGAIMEVALVNDGPVTFDISSPAKARDGIKGDDKKKTKKGEKGDEVDPAKEEQMDGNDSLEQ
ncbi:D-tyrosyl-tRNA(Tyr) deacylase [Rhizina undulata]